MGSSYQPELKPKRILLLGLYGSGKTTTAAKLAKFYQDRGLSAGLICCDVSRPAAYEQLEKLANDANVAFFGIKNEKNVRNIIKNGLEKLKDRKIIICDSSGRNALDNELINELKEINDEFKPDEKILVLSADIGQVAGKQAEEFNKAISINGVIVTKLDGSGKGGGALSALNTTKAKIMFIGTGEKIGDIEPYDSKKYISRLLAIPDLPALIDNIKKVLEEEKIDEENIDIEKLDFDTFYKELKAMNKMGPMKQILSMMGLADVPKEVISQGEEKLKKYKVIIDSMTKEERKNPNLLKDQNRIKRIAKGSGVTETEIKEMIKEFNKLKKYMSILKDKKALKKYLIK